MLTIIHFTQELKLFANCFKHKVFIGKIMSEVQSTFIGKGSYFVLKIIGILALLSVHMRLC